MEFYEDMRGLGIVLAVIGLVVLGFTSNKTLGAAALAVGALLFFGSTLYKKPPSETADTGEDDGDSDDGDDGGDSDGDGDGE